MEREYINGEHSYYNWEMAWKLGGDGRLRPDPYTWNNIGRYHHSPGPTGTTTNSAGNTVNTYQDPITGGEYYWASQEWEGDQSVRIVYETEYTYVEHIRKDFGVIAVMAFLNPFLNVLGPEFSGSVGDWLNKINNLGQRKWTDPETGTGYYIDDRGIVTGIYPTIGIAPSPAKGSKFALQLSKQLAKDGPKSIIKSYKSIHRRIFEHQTKLPGLQYRSSVEREIRTFQTQLEVLEEFMKNHGIIF